MSLLQGEFWDLKKEFETIKATVESIKESESSKKVKKSKNILCTRMSEILSEGI